MPTLISSSPPYGLHWAADPTTRVNPSVAQSIFQRLGTGKLNLLPAFLSSGNSIQLCHIVEEYFIPAPRVRENGIIWRTSAVDELLELQSLCIDQTHDCRTFESFHQMWRIWILTSNQSMCWEWKKSRSETRFQHKAGASHPREPARFRKRSTGPEFGIVRTKAYGMGERLRLLLRQPAVAKQTPWEKLESAGERRCSLGMSTVRIRFEFMGRPANNG